MNITLFHIRDLLQNNSSARDLLERRAREIALLEYVRSRLPEPMQAHCLDVGVEGTRLTLYFDSPAWTTRARFLAEDIVRSLKTREITETHIQVRLARDETSRPHQPRMPTPRLSSGTIKHLLEAADTIQDPDLRRALKNLANRHAPPGHIEAD
ncbi:DciA family protein [Thiocystis violascens]|uniref:DUF721 domain-containing protein n=1 Tax=Thiocystis violascens (strain ATCC 17096 / DSM 198 / 6111) TaxID=765911 RepID=I3YB90_THIV6|nr:DciA family protein [Thiocystis violascens]AFL74258.1 Protein of unknown function (DUF721) [Thiocystis violascens DSM 198]